MTYSSNYGFEQIVQLMKDRGEIQSSVFALYFNKIQNADGYSVPGSSLEIGGYNLSMYSSDPTQLFFVPINTQKYIWTALFTEVQIGDWSSTGNINVKIESSLNYIQGDMNAYNAILPFLSYAGFECTGHPVEFVISCLTDYPDTLLSLTFQYQGQNLILLPETIWSCVKKNCTLLIEFNMMGQWALGQAFLENYFTIYNYDNSSMGFAPAIKSVFHKTFANYFSIAMSMLSLGILF